MGKHFVIVNLTFFLFLTGISVNGETCPQQIGGSESTNEKARNLAGSGSFVVFDEVPNVKGDPDRYKYTIHLCASSDYPKIAVSQLNLNHPNTSVNIGYFKDNGLSIPSPRVFGGTDWLMIQYFGASYHTHCGGSPRKTIFFIQCDQSADTPAERKPKIIEEYKPHNNDDKEFCYYLFEMNHDGVCPPEKTKISPGSVFIIIIVIIGVLYLVLGFLYQRFIVGAKGMEQIPNYLMWREFGTLQADGCNFICRAKGAREPTRYKPMDDAIADDEDFSVDNDENDDAMLPM